MLLKRLFSLLLFTSLAACSSPRALASPPPPIDVAISVPAPLDVPSIVPPSDNVVISTPAVVAETPAPAVTPAVVEPAPEVALLISGIPVAAVIPPPPPPAIEVYPGCTPVPTTWAGLIRYVSPSGNDSNPGTIGSPMATVHHAAHLSAAGDSVELLSGNYSAQDGPGGGSEPTSNTGYVRIMPAPGATVTWSGWFRLYDSAYWLIENFSGSSKFQGSGGGSNNFSVESDSPSAKSINIALYNNDMSSIDDATGQTWSAAQWVANAAQFAVQLDGETQPQIAPPNVNCVSITYNTIHSTRYGIAFNADSILIKHNSVDLFGDDGIDYAGSNFEISYNSVTNNFFVNDGNHNDGIQGQTGRCYGGSQAPGDYCTYSHGIIKANYVNELTRPKASVPLSQYCDPSGNGMQGLDDFDEDWDDLKVTDNVVIACATHVISFYSIHHSTIANNTAVESVQGSNGGFGGCLLWTQSHETMGTAITSDFNHWWNNICSSELSDNISNTNTFDHILVLAGGTINWWDNGTSFFTSTPGTYHYGSGGNNIVLTSGSNSTVFTTYNNSVLGPSYDMTLILGSPAIGAGVLPAPDFPDGTPRTVPVNEGRYLIDPSMLANDNYAPKWARTY